MTELSDNGVQTLQHEVQRLLGRCLLRLQQYERLIKAVVAHHEISGPPHALEVVRAARVADTSRKTLGTLVGDLLGSCVVTDDIGTSAEAAASPSQDEIWVSTHMSVNLSETDFARTERDLKEFVRLRNNLVHHFIDQHDLWSLDGCRDARDALVAAYTRIDQHIEELRVWAEDLKQCRRLAAVFLQSDVCHDWIVNGIAPDSTVSSPAAGIVSALREAAREVAVDGWASVVEAGRWIAERHPEQVPAKYGCRSWRQVVHEARIFELRYFEKDGQRSAWYRVTERSASSRCVSSMATSQCAIQCSQKDAK